MDRPALPELEKIALEEFIQRVTQLYPGQITSIKLFGSRARGEARYDSDMDILVIVRDRENIDRNKLYDYVLDAELNYGIDISLKIYSQEDFDRAVELNTLFAGNIQKEGITLWQA